MFTGDGTFKTEMPVNVVRGVGDLARLIEARTEHVLSDREVARVLREIAARRLEPGRDTDRAHLRHVEERARRRGSGCPRCGSPMVERTNRTTGESFLGCDRYPKCRGTRPLS